MIDTNRTGPDAGRYLFTVFETAQAGVQRTDLKTGTTITQWASPATAPNLNSHVAFDASRWTPCGTYLTAEESWGAQPQPYGRLFELKNPITAPASGTDFMHQNVIARVSHEGLAFDKNNNMYFIDELNGGSIYKYSSATPNSGATYFSAGTNSVLRVGDGNTPNATGAYSWVDFTNAAGVGLPGSVTITDPNGITSVDGRATTNLAAFKGTDYQRPEDLEIQTLANGDQILYVATTTTNEVYSINLATNQIQTFVSRATIDAATGLAVGNALTSPDNLAIDADGNIYIVEDQPGGSADIWFAKDADRDGVAESIARWGSLSHGRRRADRPVLLAERQEPGLHQRAASGQRRGPHDRDHRGAGARDLCADVRRPGRGGLHGAPSPQSGLSLSLDGQPGRGVAVAGCRVRPARLRHRRRCAPAGRRASRWTAARESAPPSAAG